MPVNDSSALKFQAEPEPEESAELEPFEKCMSIELPDEVVPILNEMMRITGDTRELVFRKSLGLYKIAIDARLDGCKLAIVDAEDDEFVQDISGL